MEYVIPFLLVLLIVVAGVAAFVLNSRVKTTGHGDGVSADATHGGGPGIGADSTPLGDTAEHAGEQTTGGETVGGQDAHFHGGTGHPVSSYGATVPPELDAGLGAGRTHSRSVPASDDADLVDNADGDSSSSQRPSSPDSRPDRSL